MDNQEKWLLAKEEVERVYDVHEEDGEDFWKLTMGVYSQAGGSFRKSDLSESGVLSEDLFAENFVPDIEDILISEAAASFSKAKRKKVEELVITTLDKMDRSGYNGKRYKDFFKSMSDTQFHTFMKGFLADESQNFYIEITPFDYNQEPRLEDIEAAAKHLGVPLNEYMYMPFANPGGEPLRTQHPVPVGYIHMKRLQQILSKKNSFSSNIESRNAKTGQITGDDKNGRVSDAENYALVAIGAEEALKEYLGPRADDNVMKQEMIKSINKDGYTSLKNMTRDVDNKQALNTLDIYFTGAGIMTDLITPGLIFRRNLDSKEVKERTQVKYNR